MAKTGLIERFDRSFLQEKLLTSEVNKTKEAERRKIIRQDLHLLTKDAGRSGDLDLILAVERRFLENDLAEYVSSKAMADSLRVALKELSAAEVQLGKVRDPEAYKSTDEDHSLPKNRVGGVPRDQARQFFKSHGIRLLNQDKSRLDPEDKQLLDQRKVNMRAATGFYETLQREALGLPPKEQGRSRDKGMDR
ncbi:MAG: hypothetical protein K9H25_17300 [Rhodospirillum sp.]|nr:hypothetical protein [Rhodospirillum sp.]MCF8502112.1 hypothetical protein [Rhodospirillum sp.]